MTGAARRPSRLRWIAKSWLPDAMKSGRSGWNERRKGGGAKRGERQPSRRAQRNCNKKTSCVRRPQPPSIAGGGTRTGNPHEPNGMKQGRPPSERGPSQTGEHEVPRLPAQRRKAQERKRRRRKTERSDKEDANGKAETMNNVEPDLGGAGDGKL